MPIVVDFVGVGVVMHFNVYCVDEVCQYERVWVVCDLLFWKRVG